MSEVGCCCDEGDSEDGPRYSAAGTDGSALEHELTGDGEVRRTESAGFVRVAASLMERASLVGGTNRDVVKHSAVIDEMELPKAMQRPPEIRAPVERLS